jgi:hypothetical protein
MLIMSIMQDFLRRMLNGRYEEKTKIFYCKHVDHSFYRGDAGHFRTCPGSPGIDKYREHR